ncbi:hypothetical protein [Streptomyces sp. NBC_00631]|uniref:hypothetical protein n=1 Tax=Streptomyces sp. NBC_00631 TaxID=2975793 RepID=UPI0038649E48
MEPAGREHITAVVRHLEMRAHARTLRGRWTEAGSAVGQDTAELLTSELLDRAVVLQVIDTCVQVIRQVHTALLADGIRTPVTTTEQWRDIRQATIQARPIDALASAYQREADRRETGKLFQCLAEAHPDLAKDFAGDPLASHWRSPFAVLPQAWAWRQAQGFLETHLLHGREEQLEGELAQIEARLHGLVEQLVCDHAAHHCVSRMTTKHKQALAAYASAVANAGQGTTGYGKRHQRHARSAMQTAQGAVPAWIMPLSRVAETISPEPDSFDVVIVDEASQVGLDGLLLLWLAPRIIVVGDDRQCAPFYSGSKHDRITQIWGHSARARPTSPPDSASGPARPATGSLSAPPPSGSPASPRPIKQVV